MKEENSLNSDLLDNLVFGELSKKWNDTVNSIAELLDVPVAIIFKKEGDNIRVFVTNENEKNPFVKDDVIPIQGSFCNYVFKNNGKFLVPDYRDIDLDINNVATKADFISYLGFPITWPNGDFFGTICLLDDTTNYYSKATEDFLTNFSDILSDTLKLVDINYEYEREIENLQRETQKQFIEMTSYGFNPMCRSCQQVHYKDTWINLQEFLSEYPEELIRSIPSNWSVHTCN